MMVQMVIKCSKHIHVSYYIITYLRTLTESTKKENNAMYDNLSTSMTKHKHL